MQLKDLIALLDKTQKVYPDAGTLDHVIFQNAASEGTRGSIFHITQLPQYGKYSFLTFISATAEGIEMLEYYREQNLNKIKELLEAFIKLHLNAVEHIDVKDNYTNKPCDIRILKDTDEIYKSEFCAE